MRGILLVGTVLDAGGLRMRPGVGLRLDGFGNQSRGHRQQLPETVGNLLAARDGRHRRTIEVGQLPRPELHGVARLLDLHGDLRAILLVGNRLRLDQGALERNPEVAVGLLARAQRLQLADHPCRRLVGEGYGRLAEQRPLLLHHAVQQSLGRCLTVLCQHLLDMRRLAQHGQVLDGAVEVALAARVLGRLAQGLLEAGAGLERLEAHGGVGGGSRILRLLEACRPVELGRGRLSRQHGHGVDRLGGTGGIVVLVPRQRRIVTVAVGFGGIDTARGLGSALAAAA